MLSHALRASFIAIVLVVLLPAIALAMDHRLQGAGVSVTVNDENGDYTVHCETTRQDWSGSLGSKMSVSEQTDPTEKKAWDSLTLDCGAGNMKGSFTVWSGKPVVLINGALDEPRDKPPADFPNFTSIPRELHVMSYSNRT